MLVVDIDILKYYENENFWLKDINFSLRPGSILMIKGITGCGKTTLLKVLAGVIPHLEAETCKYIGDVIFDEKPLTPELIRQNVSFCFQTPEHQFLFDTVRRIFYPRVNEKANAFEEQFYSLGIDNLLNKSIRDISSGERKLVAILSSLHKKRKLRIFDEPIANLDDDRINKVLKLIADTREDSITLVASHNDQILSICDSVLLFELDRT